MTRVRACNTSTIILIMLTIMVIKYSSAHIPYVKAVKPNLGHPINFGLPIINFVGRIVANF
jgi:hypothetical protein